MKIFRGGGFYMQTYYLFSMQLLSCKIFMKIIIALFSDILNIGFLNFRIRCD